MCLTCRIKYRRTEHLSNSRTWSSTQRQERHLFQHSQDAASEADAFKAEMLEIVGEAIYREGAFQVPTREKRPSDQQMLSLLETLRGRQRETTFTTR